MCSMTMTELMGLAVGVSGYGKRRRRQGQPQQQHLQVRLFFDRSIDRSAHLPPPPPSRRLWPTLPPFHAPSSNTAPPPSSSSSSSTAITTAATTTATASAIASTLPDEILLRIVECVGTAPSQLGRVCRRWERVRVRGAWVASHVVWK